jgi:leucyl/phenylalanyl-tRNA--protein transferase
MTEPLSPELVEWAYRQGIFPMGMDREEIGWFQPDPRAIIPLDAFHVSKSLRKSAKKFEVRFDCDYEGVMRACAKREEGPWITEEMVSVYCELFRMGNGHSCETYFEGRLVGGVYGVRLGRAFMAESMFHRVTDAGKVALWRLVDRLNEEGVILFDVQYMTDHLESLGAIEISHEEYLRKLNEAL